MNLEQEINQSEERIRVRKSKIDSELSLLQDKIDSFTNWGWGFVWTGIIVGISSIIYFFLSENPQDFNLNLLGDFLGGSVASLWALAGLFFIYVAFLGQKQQLLNQQLELMYSQLEVKYTRLELAGQKEELKIQNDTLIKQRFENTFFHLLEGHNDIVNGIDIVRKRNGSYETISEGRDCFKTFYQSFQEMIRNNNNLQSALGEYHKFYEDHQSDLGHYFRNLYHIIKFIDKSKEINDQKKFVYSNLVRALLSSYELSLLFYNSLSTHGVEKFKPLLEKYSLLKNISKDTITHKEHLNSYDELAYSSSEERHEILKRRNNNLPTNAENLDN